MTRHEFPADLKQPRIYIEVDKSYCEWQALEGCLRSDATLNFLESLADSLGYKLIEKYPRMKIPD